MVGEIRQDLIGKQPSPETSMIVFLAAFMIFFGNGYGVSMPAVGIDTANRYEVNITMCRERGKPILPAFVVATQRSGLRCAGDGNVVESSLSCGTGNLSCPHIAAALPRGAGYSVSHPKRCCNVAE